MNIFEDYLRTLASSLRLKGIQESTVTDILVEIVSDPTVDPLNPKATLGSAKEFAASYEKGSTRSRGFKIFVVATMLAVATGVAKMISSFVFGVQISLFITILIYSLEIVIFITGIAISYKIDRRLPEEIERRFRS